MTKKITLAMLGLGLLTATLGGCTYADITSKHLFRPDAAMPIEPSGPDLRAGTPLAIDVHNQRGSVWVEVDGDLEAPVVEAIVSWGAGDRTETWPAHGEALPITAVRRTDGPGDVLAVDASIGDGAPDSGYVDIRVRTPRCDGVSVVNDGGPIVLVGVGGAITARNGAATGEGGRIELKTSRPIVDPVALVTTSGRVTAVIGTEGRGVIDLASERGDVNFVTAYGTLTDVHPAMQRYHGVWNGGRNPFIAKSADGNIQVYVKPNAESYSTPDSWMALLGR
ncbi:MAG: hypothetical protein H6810_08385 [Phycisphaeraceae bacterium]|nr:MAG: hypothetical protein H6810_08385 [Phycisphaeraceae bacterium]